MKQIVDNFEEKDMIKLEYHKKGEDVYVDGRQVLVRACHDAFVSYYNEKGEQGIILVKREAEPAKGYLWCLGGGIKKGISTIKSLERSIKEESGLEVKEPHLINIKRCIWKGTPNKHIKERGLPDGIDDLILIFTVKEEEI